MSTERQNGKIECLVAAARWDELAKEAEDLAAHERAIGLDLSAPGCSPGDNKARTYRDTAKSLRLEADTGIPHCVCCLKPRCSIKAAGKRP